VVEFTKTAVDLGLMLDGQLSVSRQLAAICDSCSYKIHQLKSVKSSLTREAYVYCRLDYCNFTLAGIAKVYL